ncbi:MAG: radical SAM protein [Muribaculaceae bacterium]|nr:radical SAM protein [Muribaculaceae bacterium]
MKLSKYNVIHLSDDYVLIFNTLTASIVKISLAFWQYLNSDDLNKSFSYVEKLLDMGILVKSDDDALNQYKYWYYKSAFESRTPFLYIAPTMQCNFNCFYCFEDGHKSFGKMEKTVADRLVKFLKTYGKNSVNIVWFGGEPMLGFDRILDICNGLRAENINYSSSMITNGSLFSEGIICKLNLLNLTFIQVSMDGVGDIHDKRRCFVGGKPTFNLIIENIERLLTRTSFPIVIQITIDKDNSTAYDDMVRFCKERFGHYVKNGRLQVGFNNVQNRTNFDIVGSCFTQEEIMCCELKRMQDGEKNRYIGSL